MKCGLLSSELMTLFYESKLIFVFGVSITYFNNSNTGFLLLNCGIERNMDNNNTPIEILIVEDNPSDAALMMRALRKNHLANYIKVCEDGEEALEYLFCTGRYENTKEHSELRVVFLDLKLPKINGLEVLKEIRSNEKTRKIPVVIVSSSKEDPDIKSAYDLGANSYVVKPLQFEDFVKAVSQLGMYWLILNESSQ